MSKKRAFVRYTKSGEIVPGSLILTNGSYPDKPALWKEITTDQCCDDGGGECNNCTPGTVTILSNIPIANLEFPSLLGVILKFGVNGISCLDCIYENGFLNFSIYISGEVFNAQDVVNLINNSEEAQRNGITAVTIVNIPGEGDTFQITVDTCTCLGIYLNGGVQFFNIIPNLPALPNPNN
jgi:hypothetical protein